MDSSWITNYNIVNTNIFKELANLSWMDIFWCFFEIENTFASHGLKYAQLLAILLICSTSFHSNSEPAAKMIKTIMIFFGVYKIKNQFSKRLNRIRSFLNEAKGCLAPESKEKSFVNVTCYEITNDFSFL